MKTFFIILSMSLFIIACEKGKTDQDPLTPEWLLERISQDNEILKSNPQSELAVSAWRRFEYEKSYFYENINLLSSAWPQLYNTNGTQVPFDQDQYLKFQMNRCCMKYIWKGSSYVEI